MSTEHRFTVKLFYSYSHKDSQYRDNMETALQQLKNNNLLKTWSDLSIQPGQNINKKIKTSMEGADIIVFLLSPDFIDSEPCMGEWNRAKKYTENKLLILIPIILRECAWKDIEGMANLKALPEDAKPVSQYDDQDVAWQQVYQGIKSVIENLASQFVLRDEFRSEMEKTEFISQDHIGLNDIFVFPNLVIHNEHELYNHRHITDYTQLLQNQQILIHGEAQSGKTALCRHLFLTLVDDAQPVIYIDLENIAKKPNVKILQQAYQEQFHGDYSQWVKQDNKTIIIDNFSQNNLEYIPFAEQYFQRLVLVTFWETFNAYFKDAQELVEFTKVKIGEFTHVQQEQLIKNRLNNHNGNITESKIDLAEQKVNDVITRRRIVPRYPFYILSILQTLESFMPTNLKITSSAHCYYILIVANFTKSGIQVDNSSINMCFNFLEHWAFTVYQQIKINKQTENSAPIFEEFKATYKRKFIPKDSVLNRLQDTAYGLLTCTGRFKERYIYYYFLGKYLAQNNQDKKIKQLIDSISEKSYLTSNSLILLFLMHHGDNAIVDDIVLRSMCTLDNIEPAKLDKDETKELEAFITKIPQSILSSQPVDSERKREREIIDRYDANAAHLEDEDDEQNMTENANNIYRILKNNELLGQILRNNYGNIERSRLSEIITTVIDGGLRLIRLGLLDQNKINGWATYIHKKNTKSSIDEIKQFVRLSGLLWIINFIESVNNALKQKELEPLIEQIIKQKDTPSYELIGYFFHLDTIDQFSDNSYERLKVLLRNYDYLFMQKISSIRTQYYFNTHRTKSSTVQKTCQLLGIKYHPRLGLGKHKN